MGTGKLLKFEVVETACGTALYHFIIIFCAGRFHHFPAPPFKIYSSQKNRASSSLPISLKNMLWPYQLSSFRMSLRLIPPLKNWPTSGKLLRPSPQSGRLRMLKVSRRKRGGKEVDLRRKRNNSHCIFLQKNFSIGVQSSFTI